MSSGGRSGVLENAGERRRRGDAVADRGEIARAAAVEAQARTAREKVGRVQSARRNASRIGAASTRKSSESSRRLTASGSVSGLASRSASSRAPAGVTVRSIVASSEPSRAPLSVRVSSRLARVAGSISRLVPRARRVGGDSAGLASNWVRLT